MNQVFLGLGSNIGNRFQAINDAISLLGEHSEIQLGEESSIYETEPFGYTDQPNFLNMVLEINTTLTPIDLLKYIHKIEADIGRERIFHWGPRIIDIDIILYSDKIIKNEDLRIPHSYLTERLFVLVPLSKIYNGKIPGEILTIKEMIDRLEEKEGVLKVWEI